jgi:hypothetical protein
MFHPILLIFIMIIMVRWKHLSDSLKRRRKYQRKQRRINGWSTIFLTRSQNLVLDFWIAGAHYGGGKGDFSMTSDYVLTPDMQAQLKKEIENLDIPFVKYTVETNANGARIKVDGPWAGFSGLSLGYRF